MSAVMSSTVMSAAVVPAVMARPVMVVPMLEVRTVVPSMMARPVVAVAARLPVAAAPAIADLAHLIDIGGFACDVAGLRQPVRQR
jgi:hypothetical protein